MGSCLVLGTAQFGRWYGIASEAKVQTDEVNKILKSANEFGLGLDTASDYGNAEALIGNTGLEFKLTTKIQLKSDMDVEAEVKKSLTNLKAQKIHCLLVHNSEVLLNKKFEKVVGQFFEMKSDIIENVGVSVSYFENVAEMLEKFPIDVVQVPSNLFNQQLITSGAIKKIRNKNIKLQVRSVFLQGLFLMNWDFLPYEFMGLKPKLETLKKVAEKNNTTIEKMAIEYVKSLNPESIIVGVDNFAQFEHLLKIYDKPFGSIDFAQFACDEKITNPATWSVGGWRK